ncbi:MAG: bifunctional folylpolyglutamate synthase/dihydrofolate synthase [Chloroflexi bacterium]|jgi:dihydrofolate synthase / folylpolyglutamate synthase|nr:bifunctional folylpolyglutamate synthase/dihydrofolate synthase [Chloroflexota bacterium]MBT7079896.1 bifunctional folylpolyglutamate synthase/dihydrofolate synthase [Chloroflexota bacterium]MBT7290122.1 bifunctional folylpolyglutamate synthase/dihydrofolate synthase [Chloroflexota bacterium]
MNYKESVDWILNFTDYEKIHGALYSEADFDLRRMEELLARLGDPHKSSKSVHIAGSKGKGSTATMVASALRVAGHKVGLFTSPHLHTIRERVSVDGVPIAENELVVLVAKLVPVVNAVNADARYGKLTTFEILAALAFTHFSDKRVGYKVIEVGLGGRLDATNVVIPEVSVITSISMDHVNILGDSLAKIAKEKAGIIKNGVPVIAAPQKAEAMAVIEGVCKDQNTELIRIGQDITWRSTGHNIKGQSFIVSGRYNTYDLTIPLLGEHQLENAAVAVAVLELIGVDVRSIADGLKNVYWPGRMQILKTNPLLVVDGAHNPDSMQKLMRALKQHFTFSRLILILGMSSDKDAAGIIDVLAAACDDVVVTGSRHPRSADISILADQFATHSLIVKQCPYVADAVNHAQKIAGPDDLICATGSLFIVAEVIEEVKGLSGEVYSL